MRLFESIDGLLIAAVYLFWGIALVCIPVSVILLIANIGMGLGAMMVCAAAFLLAVGVTLLLLPAELAKGALAEKRIALGIAAVVLAGLVMGITYFAAGGFPAMNLLFI